MATKKPVIPLKFARVVIKSVLNSFIEDGTIDPRGKNETQILQELARTVQTRELVPITDHTESWLKKARTAKAAGEGGFSIVCYATWAEHMLNKLVSSFCARCKVPDSVRQELIRRTGTVEKFVWLSLAITAKPPPTAQLNQLRRISETRNQYLHYKWKPEPEKVDRTLQRLTDEGERMVSAIRRFLNQHLYRGHRRRIQALMRR
jgi:hypothetical protein